MLTLLLVLPFATGAWAQPAIDPDEPWNWPDDYVFEQVNQVRAGRDLTPSSWPNGARVAVLLSYDVDNETVMGLRTGDISVGPLSQGQYGSRVALPRVAVSYTHLTLPTTPYV